MKTWSVADSLKLYNIENWGDQYFNVNAAGNITVRPRAGEGSGFDLMQVIQEVKNRGLGMPVLIRFQDITRHRVVTLNETFRKVIGEANYKGKYQGVYPIKVNQMREVVEEIIDAGRPYDYGLEAGSKAELAAVIAMETTPKSLIICNGYKDYDFIKLALMGLKLGKRVFIVVEKLSELVQVIQVSREMGVTPLIGIRTKLYTKGSGKWEQSGGESAKFGLTTPELITAIEYLTREGLRDSLKLLHFHIGSQINNIRTIRDAVKEGTRIYAKLSKMGIPMEYLDVGGGLGVDYDGSRTTFDSSINYSLHEYVSDVVYTIQEICAAEGVPEPNIVSESGRAIVAHHSVLVVNVFGNIEVGQLPQSLSGFAESTAEPEIVKEMRYLLQNVSHKNLLEHFHDALQRKEESLSMFKLGILSLEDRAKVEHIFWQICKLIRKYSKELKYVPDEIEALDKRLADQYLCNFSLFQSMPDHWAIQHLFPIIPLHRHNEEPSRETTLVDITCDSDGKVCRFVDLRDIKDTLKVHPLRDGEPYYLGFFLMGAYQDIMGDLHNLFGRVHEVHVFQDETEPNGFYVEEVIKGTDIAGVLGWIQYTADTLERKVKMQIEERVRNGTIKPREGVDLQDFYETVLHGYTYIHYEKPVATPSVTQSSGGTDGVVTDNQMG
jgi:arginine decarboxylase